MKQIEFTVTSIKATVRKGPTGAMLPGDYIVNQVEGQPLNWISRGELNTYFLSNDKPIPPMHLLKGAKILVEQHTITQEMIDEAIARGDKATNSRNLTTSGYLIPVNGRNIVFTKPGLKNVLKNIDMRGCDMSEAKTEELKMDAVLYDLQTAKTKSQVAQRELRAVPATTTTPAPGVTEEVEEVTGDDKHVDLTATAKGVKEAVVVDDVVVDGVVTS